MSTNFDFLSLKNVFNQTSIYQIFQAIFKFHIQTKTTFLQMTESHACFPSSLNS